MNRLPQYVGKLQKMIIQSTQKTIYSLKSYESTVPLCRKVTRKDHLIYTEDRELGPQYHKFDFSSKPRFPGWNHQESSCFYYNLLEVNKWWDVSWNELQMVCPGTISIVPCPLFKMKLPHHSNCYRPILHIYWHCIEDITSR